MPSDIAEEHIAFNIKGQEVTEETFLKASETSHPTAHVTSQRNIVFRNSVVSTSLGELLYDVSRDLNMFTSGENYSLVKG